MIPVGYMAKRVQRKATG